MSLRWGKFRKGLNELFLPIYDSLKENLPEGWEPYCGYRSIEEQEKLYNEGRTTKGYVKTQARGGESPHNYGCAIDIIYFQGPFPQWVQVDEKWKEIGEIVRKCGGVWGGDFGGFKDRVHVELPIKCRWTEVNGVRLAKGIESAIEFIREKRA